MSTKKVPIHVSENALNRIKSLISTQNPMPGGVRIGVNRKGCSGLSYTLSFVKDPEFMDEQFTIEGVTFCVDPKSMFYVLGMAMDFIDNKMESGFEFTNPNEKGRCGCGKSFHV